MRKLMTEETKQTISDSVTKWHENNDHPRLGTHHTEESKQKISKATKGRKFSEESVAKSARSRMMDKEKEQLIISAYLGGEQIKSISTRLDVGIQSIYRVLSRNNVDLKNK